MKSSKRSSKLCHKSALVDVYYKWRLSWQPCAAARSLQLLGASKVVQNIFCLNNITVDTAGKLDIQTTDCSETSVCLLV